MKKSITLSSKQDWKIERLVDVVDFQRGLTYSKNDEVDFSSNIVLRSNNVDLKTNKLDFTELRYINDKVDIPKNKKVLKGSLLICTANGSKSHLGKVALIDDDYDYAFGGFMGLLKPKENLNSDFFFYAMTSESYKEFIGALSDGANINNLKFSDLGNFEIPLPPILEQQRIVSILDETFAEIDKAKANAERNLKNAKELFESNLQSVFEKKGEGWEEKPLGALGIITSSKRIYKSEYVKDGVPFYRTKEIKELSKGKDISLELFISKERYQEIKTSFGVPQVGDLLMSAVGTIGEILVIQDTNEFYFKDGNIVWFKEFKCLDTNYLKFALTVFVEKIKSLAIGAAYSALTIEKLNLYEISYPKSIIEQESIVHKLDSLLTETKKLETLNQKKIEDFEELKKSILQKAFTGELKNGRE